MFCNYILFPSYEMNLFIVLFYHIMVTECNYRYKYNVDELLDKKKKVGIVFWTESIILLCTCINNFISIKCIKF